MKYFVKQRRGRLRSSFHSNTFFNDASFVMKCKRISERQDEFNPRMKQLKINIYFNQLILTYILSFKFHAICWFQLCPGLKRILVCKKYVYGFFGKSMELGPYSKSSVTYQSCDNFSKWLHVKKFPHTSVVMFLKRTSI